MTDVEALCRGFLQNAAARQAVVARVEPEEPSADYLTGFGAGWAAGQVAALAFAVGAMSGESPTTLVEDARSHSTVDAAFPFELYLEDAP
ncbi:MAG: hypothetical protein M3Y04_05585, partial [Actinomycetota bacterium]|nr:hypothetical protein [Actinomycetota bacterium]